MLQFLLILLAVNSSVFCARVKEFPFDILNDSEKNETTLEEMTTMSTVVSEVLEELTHLEEETIIALGQNNLSENKRSESKKPGNKRTENKDPESKEGSPILSALRNFWAQASVSLMDPVGPTLDEPKKHEEALKAIERSLVEATTLMNRMDQTTPAPKIFSKEPESVTTKTILESVPPKHKPESVSTKTKTEDVPQNKGNHEPLLPKVNKPDTASSKKTKSDPKPQNRQGDMPAESTPSKPTLVEIMTNLSSSCSNCYERLNKCVMKCFEEHNCKDIERKVHVCPAAPSRICNMFTQWNLADECSADTDCSSPLLCCNDGCKNKCLPGIPQSF